MFDDFEKDKKELTRLGNEIMQSCISLSGIKKGHPFWKKQQREVAELEMDAQIYDALGNGISHE